MYCALCIPLTVPNTLSPPWTSHAVLLQPASDSTPQHRGVSLSFCFSFLTGLSQVLSSSLDASCMASLVLMNAGKVEIGLGVRSSALQVSPQGILQYIKNLVHCLVQMPKNTLLFNYQNYETYTSNHSIKSFQEIVLLIVNITL